MRKTVVIVGLTSLGLVATALAGVGLPEEARGEEASARTVTVTGTGVVDARPDEAAFSFGVDTHAPTAEQAGSENATAMRRLIAALKDAGVEDDDIQTQHVSVWPDGKPETGYRASNSVQVSTTVERAGPLVSVATAAGATTLWGPSLALGESHELEEQALERALADARRKASALAAAAGANLGQVVRMVEGGAEPYPEYARSLAADAAGGAPPIEPGKLEKSASLTVTFALG